MMKREPAWRVFAGEYNDATVEIKGSGEKTPSYLITPLGAKINRVFIIGVLTDVENVKEGGELLRAHLSDPTGVFTLYSGQYQPEATTNLSHIDVPAFVAVIGKARTYTPEGGELYVSIRPEIVYEVTAEIRDRWIVETGLQTKERISAILEGKKMNPPNAYDLRKLGYSKILSEGVVTALKQYPTIDIRKYVTSVQESLQYLYPKREKPKEIKKPKKTEKKETPIENKPVEKEKKRKKEEPPTEEPSADEPETEDAEKSVLRIIHELEGENGAAWDEIMKKCKKTGLSEEQIEEALTALMDKGLIYEPVLGTIKTT
ncbi:MAG: hypothetical protein V1726_05840 [Methanobacteriota archaeon]